METNFDFIDSNEKIQITKYGFEKKKRDVPSSLKLGKSISEIFDDFFLGQYWEKLLIKRTRLMDFEERADYLSVAYEVCDSLHSIFNRRFENNPSKYAIFMSEIQPKTLIEDFGFDIHALEQFAGVIFRDMPFLANENFYYQGENLRPVEIFGTSDHPELYCRPRTISRMVEHIYDNRI